MLEEEQKEEKEYLPRLDLIMIKLKSLNKNFQFVKILKEKKLIDLNYAYVIFGKNNVYKDSFKFILEETNKTFKKINSYTWKY